MRTAVGRALLASGAALALLAGCGGDAPPSDGSSTRTATTTTPAAPGATALPALCRQRPRARVTGRVRAPFATELSGLVVSPSRRDLLWTHNDSGDEPRLLAVTASGRPVAVVALTGADAVDWEDIAAGPRGSLLVGDIGDNAAARDTIVVYRVPESLASGALAPSARYELRYPDGPRDAEALLYDRVRDAIVLVTKSFAGAARVYVARRPSARRVTTLRRAGAVALGVGQPVTAGDVSADGRTIALRSYDEAFVWRRRAGESVAAALRRAPCRPRARLAAEGQGEALALTRDGRALLTVPEGSRPLLRRYAAAPVGPR